MPRPRFNSLAILATLSASAVFAPSLLSQAPIERPYANQQQAYAQPTPPPDANADGSQAPYGGPAPYGNPAPYGAQNAPPPPPRVTSSQPIAGVYVRVAEGASAKAVTADANGTEIRVDGGIANITVRHPAANVQILVDLPGGQVALVKDGIYTFNAQTNTVGVLDGEADALGSHEPIRVKEGHQFVFAPGGDHPIEANFAQLRNDLLPAGRYANGDGYPAYGYAPGYYAPYPYYAYGWGYPGWYGYPYVGLGFGYYGGWGRGWGGGWGGGRGFGRR